MRYSQPAPKTCVWVLCTEVAPPCLHFCSGQDPPSSATPTASHSSQPHGQTQQHQASTPRGVREEKRARDIEWGCERVINRERKRERDFQCLLGAWMHTLFWIRRKERKSNQRGMERELKPSVYLALVWPDPLPLPKKKKKKKNNSNASRPC